MSSVETSAAVTAAARTAKVVSCPACGASITLRALGQSVMAACPSCRTQIDVSRPDIQIICKYQEEAAKLRMPLGTRGTLRGQTFEVVGAMGRAVPGYHWEEYLLFNPYLGFRWLVFDSGHWNFGQMVKENLSITSGGSLEYRGRSYTRFQTGDPIVEWVIGEFYWRVAVGDQVRSSDYIAPPFMLSLEKSDDEIVWTLLEYLEPSEVDAAFNTHSPRRHSIAPNQPNPASASLRNAWRVALAALAIACLIQVGTALRARSRPIDVGSYSFAKGAPAEQLFGPYTFDAPFSLNELSTRAGLSNSWVELNSSLVNTKTGETYEIRNAFSYYYGTDSDGQWSEGGNEDTSLITSIPAGTYNLVVEGASGDASEQRISQDVHLTLTHDVVPWRNFWLAVLAILAYPALLFRRIRTVENSRWSESDESD